MYTREQIEQQIWDYIDGLSTPEEKAMVEKLLHADPLWKSIYEELLSVDTMISDTDLVDQPSLRFTKGVMEEVAKYKVAPPASSYVNKKIIYGIAAFFIISLVGLLGYAFTQFSFSVNDATPLVDTKNWEIDFSKYFNSTVINIFLFFDVIAGLMLLDRYLRRKRYEEVRN